MWRRRPRSSIVFATFTATAVLATLLLPYLELPQAVFTLWIIPIVLGAPDRSRLLIWGMVGVLVVCSSALALQLAAEPLHEIIRAGIQVGVLLVVIEILRFLARGRDQALADLTASEQRYRLLVETANVVPWELDLASCNFSYVGPQAARLLGYPIDQWYEPDFWVDHLHPDDRAEASRFCQEATQRGEDHEFEYRMISADGGSVWIRDLVSIVLEQGRPVGLRGVMMDLTNQRQREEQNRALEARAVQSEKLETLGLLAGGVAHDFNNLLTLILTNCDLALADGTSATRAPLDTIARAAERAGELTRQLLAYAGRSRLDVCKQDLAELARDNEELLSAVVPANCVLAIDLPREPLSVCADSAQIHHIIMNMIANAVDAVGERSGTIGIRAGRVRVTAPRANFSGIDLSPGHYAYIEVSDDGPGMEPEIARRIFEPFFTNKQAGRGLGLAAALGIARAHGGGIEVDTAPGSGTRIRLLLPLADASVPEARLPNTPVSIQGSHLLVVDDEQALLAATRDLLQRQGARVETASSGQLAIDLLRKSDGIDLVVLDLKMPGLSGLETLERLREFRPNLPVVLMSGHVAGLDFLESDVDPLHCAFIAKPFRVRELVDRIGELLCLAGGARPEAARAGSAAAE